MKSHKGENKNKHTMISWTDHFPIEITTNILTRLPVKSVLRFRSICKTWLSVIDNPTFPIMHFDAITNNPSSSSSSVILTPSASCRGDSIQVFSLSEQVLKFPNINLDTSSSPLYPVGSCNGLLCFCTSMDPIGNFGHFIYIYNPITGEYVVLPPIPRPDSYGYIKPSVGFGFDSSTKEFKVIGLLYWTERSRYPRIQLVVHMYTLGASTSWKKLEHAPFWSDNYKCSSGVFVSGSLHWLAESSSIGQSGIHVVSFDLQSESFEVMPNPEFSFLSHNHAAEFRQSVKEFELGVLRGCLCLSDCASLKDHIEIWVMNDYNARKSWTKQFVIRKDIMDNINVRAIIPVSFWVNGELLLYCDFGSLFISYNPESGKATLVDDDGFPNSTDYLKAFPYVGTLISPKSVRRIEGNNLEAKNA